LRRSTPGHTGSFKYGTGLFASPCEGQGKTVHSPGHTRPVKIIDEMLSLDLLSPQQHSEIALWVRSARTPEAILAMPPHLWRAIEAASVAMNVDADLTRPPWLGADLT
jgi:hypothetical protein